MIIKRKYLYGFMMSCIIIAVLLVAFSSRLVLRRYTVSSKKITSRIRIVHISDLHSQYYGEDQGELIYAIQHEDPDIIVLTGDILDKRGECDAIRSLILQIVPTYPCYYVTGNHEYDIDNIAGVKESLEHLGVEVLSGDCLSLMIGENVIDICGIDDPSVGNDEWQHQLESCYSQKNKDHFSLLLSHRPERVNAYKSYPFDLILSGHAHGGQVRIPRLINGLFAPNQGFFPKYAGGLYKLSNGTLIVSRGLKRSLIPRIFNPPELVTVDIVPDNTNP